MQKRLWGHAFAAAALSLVALPFVVSSAAADQAFHTTQADLAPIGSASLHSGFVNDVHASGGQIYAQERYQLNGAVADTTYSVALEIAFADATCSVADLTVPTATFTTNTSGNGEAGFTFSFPGPAPAQVFIRWVISTGGVPQYETGCVPVTLD
jgi:hypothetical protein